jgi:hypothetical protein
METIRIDVLLAVRNARALEGNGGRPSPFSALLSNSDPVFLAPAFGAPGFRAAEQIHDEYVVESYGEGFRADGLVLA